MQDPYFEFFVVSETLCKKDLFAQAYFWELSTSFLGKKNFNSLIRIRDLECCQPWIRNGKIISGSGVVDTGGKFATGINSSSETGGKICRRCRWYRWCTLTCEYLREFSKKFETVLMGYPTLGLGETDSWKKLVAKISWHCSFKQA